MDFLSYKDILFEISNYLSICDLRTLKLALPDLDIKPLHQTKLMEVEKYKTSHLSSIKEIIANIFETGRDKFLLYNRRYDEKTLTLTVDIDVNETTFLYSTGSVDTDTCPLIYQECINPILIDDFIVKLRNGCQLFFSIVQYRNEISGPEELTILFNKSYVEYLLTSNQLKNFVDRSVDQLSNLATYFGPMQDEYIFYIGAELSILIWNYLPKDNRRNIQSQLSEILDKEINGQDYWMDDDQLNRVKNWLEQNSNKRNLDQLN